jgi:hypothetical protein
MNSHRSRARSLAAASALTLSLLFFPLKAEAKLPDNKYHDINGESLTSMGEDARQWAQFWFTGNDGSYWLKPYILNNNGSGDVHVKDDWYGTGYYGQTICTSHLALSSICDHMTIRLNQQTLSSSDSSQWKSTACHELGHTVDLYHHDGSCMAAPGFPYRYNSTDQYYSAVVASNLGYT